MATTEASGRAGRVRVEQGAKRVRAYPGGQVVADGGQVGLSLAYQQGGMVLWVTAEQPNLPLYAAKDPRVVRWYQEDQVLDVVRSDPLQVSGVSDLSLDVQGELADVFDGHQRVVAVFIQRPYMRQVYEP